MLSIFFFLTYITTNHREASTNAADDISNGYQYGEGGNYTDVFMHSIYCHITLRAVNN